MLNKSLTTLLLSVILFSCQEKNHHLQRIEGKRLEINNSLSGDKDIETFIKPFRNHINNDLDSVISYSRATYSKSDGELNTAIGNFFADAVYEQANPIFKSRTGEDIDLVILNHGGIRSIISKGNLTKRTAYEIMPFENSIVVVKLKGKNIHKAVEYLREAKRAHPISKLQITLDRNYSLTKSSINGKSIDSSQTYYLATNDYLYNGGDNMTFLKPNDTVYLLDYKIRNALMDYLLKTDTIAPEIDNRFIKVN